MSAKRMTPELVEQARKLRLQGWDYGRIGEAIGFTGTSVHCALDPEYAAQRRANINSRRREATKTEVRRPPLLRENTERASVKIDAEARMAEIPADTRNLTARLCGDPLPGRSALDRTPPHSERSH